MQHSSRVFLSFFVLAFICVEYQCKASDYDVTFYNVGQGDCTIIKYPNSRVLFVDAGTSETRGVVDIAENDKEKTEKLARSIVDFITPDLEISKWLFFIITHSDQDHLNLIPFIISKFFEVAEHDADDYKIGVLFGGTKNSYSITRPCKFLLKIIEDYNIPHIFGGDAFKIDSSRLFYVPKPSTPHSPQRMVSDMLKELTVHFLSVKSDVDYGDKKLTREKISNAESIVLKVKCNSKSIIITGDKTRKEIECIIRRFEAEECLDELAVDILLATHHGSESDFCEDWASKTNPRCVVFSAGFSSHSHPRNSSIYGYLSDQSRRIHTTQGWKWHFVHFHGDKIIMPSFCSIYTEVPLTDNKPKGYTHAATNVGMFVTGSQGSIGFTLSATQFKYKAEPTYESLPDAINTFIADARLPNGELIEPNAILLDFMAVNWFSCRAPTLRMLSIRNCITNINVDELCDYIGLMPNLLNLDMTNNVLSVASVQKIKNAWGHRGLLLDNGV